MPTSLTKRLTLLFGTKGANRVQATMSRIGGGITSITNKLASMAKMAVKVGVVMSVALGAVAVSAAANFEDAMVKSTAIMGDLSSAMVNEMSAAAREVALVTKFSAKEAADAYFFLASAGLDAKQSIEAIPTVAAFAQAGNFDLALATDLLTDAQSALGLTIKNDVVKNMENMLRVSDVLVKANTLANATVQQFSEALTTEAGAALKSFNIDVEEGVAVLAAFADQGIKGQTAGTSLSRILRLMTSAAVKNADAYEKFNVRVFDASGGIRNLADIVADLENALGGLSDATRVSALGQLGFQARVQGVILPLLGTSDAIKRYESELRKAGGTTKNIAEKQMVSLKAQFGLLKDAITDVLLDVGGKMLPVITEIVQKLRTFVLENRGAILGVIEGLKTVIGFFVKIIGFAVKWVIQNKEIVLGIGAILAAIGLVSIAVGLLTSPIVLIGLAVVALIEIWRRWGGDIKKVINTAIQRWVFFFDMLKIQGEAMVEKMSIRVNQLVGLFKAGAKAATGSWAEALVMIQETQEDTQLSLWAVDKAVVSMLRDSIKRIEETDYIGAAFNKIGEKLQPLKDKITGFLDIFKPVAGGVGGAGVAAEEAAKAVRDRVDKIKPKPLTLPTIEIAPLEETIIPFNIQLRETIALIMTLGDTFAEKMAVIGAMLRDTFGTTAQAAFAAFTVAGETAYNVISRQSAAFFAGESKRLLNFRELGKQIWAEVQASALDAIAGILKARAVQWALEAGAALAIGNFVTAARLFAQSTAAGAGAGLITGAAAGVRRRAAQSFTESIGQPAPLTEEERAAGVVTPRGSVAGTTRGTVTQLPARNITIAPVTTITGEFIVIGTGGIEEAEQTLGDVIVKRIQEAEEGGEI